MPQAGKGKMIRHHQQVIVSSCQHLSPGVIGYVWLKIESRYIQRVELNGQVEGIDQVQQSRTLRLDENTSSFVLKCQDILWRGVPKIKEKRIHRHTRDS